MFCFILCFFVSLGQRPFWMHLGEEFHLLWDDLKEAYTNVTSAVAQRWKSVVDSPFGILSRVRQSYKKFDMEELMTGFQSI